MAEINKHDKQYRAITGVNYLAFLPIIKNTDTEFTVGEGVEYSNLRSFSESLEGEITEEYANNNVIEQAETRNGGTIQIDLHNLPEDLEELLKGTQKDEDGVIWNKSTDKTPEVLVIAGATKEVGGIYKAYLAVKFNQPEFNAETKTDSTSFQTVSIEGNFRPIKLNQIHSAGVSYEDDSFDLETFIAKVTSGGTLSIDDDEGEDEGF